MKLLANLTKEEIAFSALINTRMSDAEIRSSLAHGKVIYGSTAPLRITKKLWRSMLLEFIRSGGKILTRGKVRFLRRKLRKPQSW